MAVLSPYFSSGHVPFRGCRCSAATAVIKFVFVASKNNVADLFTKILALAAFKCLARTLMCRGMLPRGGC